MYDSAISYTEDMDRLIQSQMLSALELIVDPAGDGILYKIRNGRELSEAEKQALFEECRRYFPTSITPDGIEPVLRELFSVIASADRYIPSLMGEYALSHALSFCADLSKSLKDEGFEPYRLDWDRRRVVKDGLMKRLAKSYGPDRCFKMPIEDEAEEILCGIEQMDMIEDLCFHDIRYMWLDKYPPEELVSNGMDCMMDLGAMEPARLRDDAAATAGSVKAAS